MKEKDQRLTPEQRRKNRNTALVLVVFVIAIMVWAFWRGSSLIS